MENLCAPALIYLIFSITQILIDTYKGLYNTVIIKSIVTITVTLLLNILCEQGLSIVSWIIVFIPFILMTVVVSMLLYALGLDPKTGTINYKCDDSTSSRSCGNNITIDTLGNIVIYDPEYNPKVNPVYYRRPNIIVPNPSANDSTMAKHNYRMIPRDSSSPVYQS
jgi:hypothetical protein